VFISEVFVTEGSVSVRVGALREGVYCMIL
jgi:hypothetical protein